MSTRIRFRRDTAANWTTNNPTLTTGELGYETDTGKFKIGNNTNAWTALAYSITAELSEGNLNDLKDVTITSAANGDFLRWNGTAWINDAVNLSTDTVGNFVESLVAGTGVTLTNNSGEAATPTVAIGQSVATSASVSFARLETTGNVVVGGNLTVSGTTTTINSETLTVDDNLIVLNNNATGAPTENAGIEVERGSSTNVVLRWNETDDAWELTNDGSTYSAIATASSVATATTLSVDNLSDTTITSAAAGQFLKYNGTAWVNDAIDLATDTTGSFVQSLVAGTGVTLANNSGENATPTVTVDTSVIQARVANVSDTEIGYLDGVTSAIQTQIDTKSPLASPTFTGVPAAPTAAAATNTTQIATTAFVRAEVAALVGTAGATLDTLGELATALGNDAALSTTLTTSIGLKAPIASPTFTGTVTIPSGASISGFAPLASPALTGTPTSTTAAVGTSTTQIATTAFVFSSVDNDQFILAGQIF